MGKWVYKLGKELCTKATALDEGHGFTRAVKTMTTDGFSR
jgi:hypothetical protein